MTQKEFEEELVFNKYKDTSFRSSKEFRREVKEYRNIDARAVYTKMVNYQIKTYGGALNSNEELRVSKERANFRARQRTKNRRKTRGIYENQKEKRWKVYE